MSNEFVYNFLFGFLVLSPVIALITVLCCLFVMNRMLRNKETESTRFTSRKLDLNIGGNPLLGVAGEDLRFGDCVVIGEDGKIHKARSGQ